MLPFAQNNLPFIPYIQDLAHANNITSPVAMTRFLENLQKELFSAAMDTKGIPLPPFSQTVHHHHHPYFSQVLLNNSFINHYPSPPPSLTRFTNPPSDGLHPTFPFQYSTPKKRRTKVRFYYLLNINNRYFLGY
jgi:hypothetical protein